MRSATRAADIRAGRPMLRIAPIVTRRPVWVPNHTQLGSDILWVSAIAAVSGCGLLTVAVADTIARGGSRWAEPVFWAGLFMLWVPSSLRIVGRNATRRERIALLAMLSIGVYVVSILYSPRYFTDYDPLNHWRAAQDMMRTGRLFSPNPGLSIISHYPGLEITTTALSNLTGLSTMVAGRIIIAVARLIMILSLYLLYERVGRSIWLASVAALVYCTNPQFLFDTSYSYESLGIALAVLALYVVAHAWAPSARKVPSPAPPISTASGSERASVTLLVVLLVAATVVTHHITSYALALTLVLLPVLSYFSHATQARWWLWGNALAAVTLVLVWFYPFAHQMIDYLGPPISGGVRQVIKLVGGGGISRHLFQNQLGPQTPVVERAASYAFVVITILAALLGSFRMWRNRPFETFPLLLALGSLLYPVTGLFHLTTSAVLGVRAFAFIFVPVAFCVAMAARPPQMRTASYRRTGALVLCGTLLFYGGVTLARPPWNRLPGPYLVSADARSIELEGISAGSWAGKFLPHNSRMAADRVNSELMIAWGDQWPVRTAGHEGSLTPIFLTRGLTARDRILIRDASLQYIVDDYRLTRSLPWLGFYYYYQGESGAPTYRRPIPVAAIAKFDRTPGASRVFDSGNIVIFDVGGLAGHG